MDGKRFLDIHIVQYSRKKFRQLFTKDHYVSMLRFVRALTDTTGITRNWAIAWRFRGFRIRNVFTSLRGIVLRAIATALFDFCANHITTRRTKNWAKQDSKNENCDE